MRSVIGLRRRTNIDSGGPTAERGQDWARPTPVEPVSGKQGNMVEAECYSRQAWLTGARGRGRAAGSQQSRRACCLIGKRAKGPNLGRS
jgi:hypothetical protein